MENLGVSPFRGFQCPQPAKLSAPRLWNAASRSDSCGIAPGDLAAPYRFRFLGGSPDRLTSDATSTVGRQRKSPKMLVEAGLLAQAPDCKTDSEEIAIQLTAFTNALRRMRNGSGETYCRLESVELSRCHPTPSVSCHDQFAAQVRLHSPRPWGSTSASRDSKLHTSAKLCEVQSGVRSATSARSRGYVASGGRLKLSRPPHGTLS